MKRVKLLLATVLFSCLAVFPFAGVEAATDYSGIKQEKVKEILQNNETKFTEIVELGKRVKDQTLSLKIAIINQGGIENNQELVKQGKDAFSRNAFTKILIGPNYKALAEFDKYNNYSAGQIEQMRQIDVLIKKAGETEVGKAYSEAITYLSNNNNDMKGYITKENKSFSLFGWVVKIFQ